MSMVIFTNRQLKIIESIIKANNTITSKELAIQNNVSDRTVKNDLRQIINTVKKYEITLMSSPSKGYWMDNISKGKCIKLLDENAVKDEDNNIFLDIFMDLLVNDETDIDDLCDKYYVSRSFVENKLKDIRDILLSEGNFLKLVKSKSMLNIEGSERLKRQMMNTIIFSDMVDDTTVLENYSRYLNYEMLQYINHLLVNYFKKFDITIDDINLLRISIYIAISVERIAKGYHLQFCDNSDCCVKDYADESKKVEDDNETITELIVKEVSEQYSICFSDYDKEAISNYIAMNRILYLGDNGKKITLNDDQYTDIVRDIMNKIKDEFIIDFSDDETLLAGLAFHIENLMKRTIINDNHINPILDEFRITYPFIFEVAVFTAQCLSKKIKMKVDENEIGFFAIHIGAAVQRMNKVPANQNVKVAITCHTGYSNTLFLLAKLQSIYKNNVIFKPIFSKHYINDVADDCDIILSTFKISRNILGNKKVIYINPLLSQEDIERINEIFNDFYHTSYGKYNYLSYLNEKVYFSNLKYTTKDEIIKYMSAQMEKRGYVDSSFYKEVCKREELCSTAAKNLVAMPHALEPVAKKTVIGIGVLEKPINWDDRKVQIVFLLAIEKSDTKYMSRFYEFLVDLMDNYLLVNKLIKASSFNEFISLIK